VRRLRPVRVPPHGRRQQRPYATTHPYTPAEEAAWRAAVEAAARAETAGQTGFDAGRLATEVTVTLDQAGGRRVRVEAAYTGFRTLVSWPGIPDSPVMRSAVEMPSIR
jgi:hypothetical protein